MAKRILVTGGAGFIGSHLVDRLVAEGHEVRIFDSLEEQVHGPGGNKPSYLNPNAEFVLGDMRNRDEVLKALDGVEVVFHKAAAVGVGQSMYEIEKYVHANSLGGAILLDCIVNNKTKVEKIIVASSMSIYGEGAYLAETGETVYPQLRSLKQFQAKRWELERPVTGEPLKAVGTPETKPLFPTSIYAITKRDHEEMFLATGRSYKIPAVALRYFNVYGPRQALSNPYTGVCAIFSSRILNNESPWVYENGLQSRDFVHVSDIAQANLLAMESSEADYEVLNVGTGRALSINDVGNTLIEKIKGPDSGIKLNIIGKYREGDIRHCYADISKIRERIGYEPKVKFEDGITDLTDWVKKQTVTDGFEKARKELESRGLTS